MEPVAAAAPKSLSRCAQTNFRLGLLTRTRVALRLLNDIAFHSLRSVGADNSTRTHHVVRGGGRHVARTLLHLPADRRSLMLGRSAAQEL
jgi:hypothetical protein